MALECPPTEPAAHTSRPLPSVNAGSGDLCWPPLSSPQMAKKYTAENLAVLEGLDPVRKRPGMYTDTESPFHLLAEVVDNSVDEALDGHCSRIEISLEGSDGYCVSDNGRGIPPDIHKPSGLSGIEVVLSRLHSGGKFDQESYRRVGGLHGVGLAVVNALSSSLDAEVHRNRRCYQMSFADGEATSKLGVKPSRRASGTRIRFRPNPSHFESQEIDRLRLHQFLEAKAVLCPGLEISLDEGAAKPRKWLYHEGIGEYFAERIHGQSAMPATAIVNRSDSEEGAMDFAMSWNSSGHSRFQSSYVNLVPTRSHGAHVNAFRSGIAAAMREFCVLHELMPKNMQFIASDVCSTLDFLLSVRIDDPRFIGQTKDRLAPGPNLNFINRISAQQASLWLNSHAEEGERIARFLIDCLQKKRMSLKVGKQIKDSPALPDKLVDCSSTRLEDRELFLVEGDSAGGSARQARSRATQAILPLRGKILNTWEVDADTTLLSREVRDIASAIGVKPGSDDISRLRYQRICILADADADGAHIATLICALFVRHFSKLVEAGHLYLAKTPLYRIDHGKEVHYASDDNALRERLDEIARSSPKAKPAIIRFKGLGEMNPAQLRQTTMDPAHRQLLQLGIDDETRMKELFDNLLARLKSSWRREWLYEKGNLIENQD